MQKTLILIGLYFHFVGAIYADNLITLNLNNPSNPAVFELDEEKGYWKETYNTSEEYRWIEFDLFSFSHISSGFGGGNVGGGMSYWDGFTYCTTGDNTNYGEGGSGGWVSQQWGCMAGGGIKTDNQGKVLTDDDGKIIVEKGIPYLVAYWGYWIESEETENPSLQVKFTDNKAYEPVGVYICNHPWAYYGNISGDGFANSLTREGDYFKLSVHGLNEKGEDIGITVDYLLAEFKNGELIQSPDWHRLDLSELGSVNGIYFTMETSDSDPIHGPNTAVYFCLDKLQVRSTETTIPTPSRPSGLKGISSETTIDFSWSASAENENVKGYNLYLNGLFKAFAEDTLYTFTGLFPYTNYQIGIEAVTDNETLSGKAFITVKTTDETPPSMPENLSGTTAEYTMTLSWDASTDNVAVTEYHIYLNGERQRRVTDTSFTLTGLDSGTTYFVEVEARDEAGNRSEKANKTISTQTISTSIDTKTNDINIDLHSEKIFIKATKEARIEIYALTGIRVLSEAVFPGNNIIDLTHLSHGNYIVKYENQRTKFIK